MTIYSPLSLDECVAILKGATVADTTFGTIFIPSGTLICKSNGDNFRLRQKKSYNNSFAPCFYGKLARTEKGAEISGEFRMRPFTVAFMVFWFGMLALMGGTFIVTSLGRLIAGHGHVLNPSFFVGIFAPLLMAVFGFALVRFGKWLGKSEEARMTEFLQTAFSGKAVPSALASGQTPPPKTNSMIGAILFFGGLGLMSLVFSLINISSFQSVGPTVTYFSDPWERTLAMVNGLLMILTAYGIWERRRLAWKAGFLIFALGAITSVPGFLNNQDKIPLPAIIFMTAAILVVGAYWTFWWYKKKDYFVN